MCAVQFGAVRWAQVAINTAAIKDSAFITAAARRFGSQCIVGSIEAIRKEVWSTVST